MGLLDLALGSVLGGGRGRARSTVVNAVLLALATKAVQHFLSQRQSGAGGGADAGASSDLGDVLGDVLRGAGGSGGAGGLGGMLGGLGGAGALDKLLERFNIGGEAERPQSWVGTGANAPLAAQDVTDALDDDDLEQLSHEMKMPKDQVAHELAAALPGAIDQLTPEGRLPTEVELQKMADDYEARAAQAARVGL